MHLQLAGKSLSHFTQQFNGFVGHLRRVGTLSLRCGLGVQVTAGLSILPWYVAFGPSQRTGILPSANRPSRGFADSLPSPHLAMQHHSPADNHAPVPVHAAFFPPFASGCRFSKGFAPPPSVTSARALSSCSVIDPLPPFSRALSGHFHWSRSDRSICARSHAPPARRAWHPATLR